jgi:hypothetical protein
MRYYRVSICYCLTWQYVTSAFVAAISQVGWNSPGFLVNPRAVFTTWCYGLQGHGAMHSKRRVSAFRRKILPLFSGQKWAKLRKYQVIYRSKGKGKEFRLIGFLVSLSGRGALSLPCFGDSYPECCVSWQSKFVQVVPQFFVRKVIGSNLDWTTTILIEVFRSFPQSP